MCYALATVFTLYSSIDLSDQIFGSLLLITLFGIPHGAIDNIIFQSQFQINKNKFYFVYLLCILIYILVWILFPAYSFFIFLIISSYHFGESQLADFMSSIVYKRYIYFFWGVALMSTLFFYNSVELKELFSSFEDTKVFNYIFEKNYLDLTFYISNSVILFSLLAIYIKKNINKKNIQSEIFQLFLIHITFYLFPVIISFTLYFVILHSLKVLSQEYSFLCKNLGINNLFQFIKMLTPLTILSLIFISLFVFMSLNDVIDISVLLFAVICISVVTLPHSIVMTRFYEKIKK